MPTIKLPDTWEPKALACRDSEHEPPGMLVYEPGTYLHECPGCGNKTVFVVRESELRL